MVLYDTSTTRLRAGHAMRWADLGSRNVRPAAIAGACAPLGGADWAKAGSRAVAAGLLLPLLLMILSSPAIAAATGAPATAEPLYLLGIPVDFVLFGLTLLGV